jgi:hypothetical protein
VSVPTGSVEVVTDAVPPAVTVEVPNTVAPFENVTVPVTPAGRVAVIVTVCPYVDGLGEELTVTVGAALFTVCVVEPVPAL